MSAARAQRAALALRDATHILLRGLPMTITAQDVRRHVAEANLKGVSEVSLYYKHFRPTGKAILTMALPDYTRDAIRDAEQILIPGCKILAEPVVDLPGLGIRSEPSKGDPRSDPELLGTGPSAGVPERRTVTLHGLRGKSTVGHVMPLLKGFRLSREEKYPVQHAPLPERKFSLVSRFVIYLDSESEAQKFIRKFHMTRYKNIPDAPLIKVSLIF